MALQPVSLPRSSDPTGEGRRLEGIDALRGIAALSVCYCHFVIGSATFLPETSLMRQAGPYAGLYGVNVFFVISGFVIALSLYRADYRLGVAPKYLLRRIVRIDPPYLVHLLLAVILEHVLIRLPHYIMARH